MTGVAVFLRFSRLNVKAQMIQIKLSFLKYFCCISSPQYLKLASFKAFVLSCYT